MNELAYQRLTALASAPEAREKAAEYLASHMGRFLKKRDKVLICFRDEPASLGSLMKEAVLRCEASPLFLEQDRRWLTLLKTAFVTRCDAIIGPPLTLLGLAKVAKHMGTPLFARNVLLGGYPCRQWMINGIQQGLDCRVWRCYDPGYGAIIAGFSCQEGHIHLRQLRYQARILDEAGNSMPDGQVGRVMLSPDCAADIEFETGDRARLDAAPCRCGLGSPRLMEVSTRHGVEPAFADLWESFHHWGSILDCRMNKSENGLEVELVVFPGEKLPKIPSCAKLLVRAWNPEADEPFSHGYVLKKRLFS